MNRFDEIINKAKEIVDVAGNKTKEMAELTKLRLQASQLRSEIDKNYLKLGELIYQLNKAGTQNQELIDMSVAEIESQLVALSELEDKVNEMKKVVKCPQCGAANVIGSLYCSRCGASLENCEACSEEEANEQEDCGCHDGQDNQICESCQSQEVSEEKTEE
ncbi:zinc ribbon domain-containing protein [Youxingia wuxianensis]|uniref:Zinc ribbon domain-containing protein n=1 Tax=Youxingia wuxianensis TaxID=2763678 RepID=A0A926EPF5_9FIRM|nr:zinc ribbon domain-containing protein [Youxingia wuxianensis]MBC8585002.1 zinc ribbon domain-containing protein [Youxingia wuxianensis]